jgi:hypothetical protein
MKVDEVAEVLQAEWQWHQDVGEKGGRRAAERALMWISACQGRYRRASGNSDSLDATFTRCLVADVIRLPEAYYPVVTEVRGRIHCIV